MLKQGYFTFGTGKFLKRQRKKILTTKTIDRKKRSGREEGREGGWVLWSVYWLGQMKKKLLYNPIERLDK